MYDEQSLDRLIRMAHFTSQMIMLAKTNDGTGSFSPRTDELLSPTVKTLFSGGSAMYCTPELANNLIVFIQSKDEDLWSQCKPELVALTKKTLFSAGLRREREVEVAQRVIKTLLWGHFLSCSKSPSDMEEYLEALIIGYVEQVLKGNYGSLLTDCPLNFD